VTDTRRLLVPLLGALIVIAIALDLQNRPPETGIDFHTYDAAAVVGLQQGWAHLYDQGLVKLAQLQLVPTQRTQPFLSPPPVAWITAPFSALPYSLAFGAWTLLTLGVFALALAYSTTYAGWARLVAVGLALVPWWVLHAVGVGQVVPLVAAGILIAWRLLRDRRDVLAGVALGLVLLKPNTAMFVPFVLLATGRIRTFVAWLGVGVAVLALSVATLGSAGVSAYFGNLSHLPSGANALTLNGTFGLIGAVAAAVRAIIVVTAFVTAYRVRSSPGMAIVLGALASLLTAPYLHGSDLCVFVAAGWIVWHERPAPVWRAMLVAMWIFATPVIFDTAIGPMLNRWAIAELMLFAAIVVWAWAGERLEAIGGKALTGSGDAGKHAPA
jgi:glycosyl transferase family 87